MTARLKTILNQDKGKMPLSSQHLLVHSKRWKHQNNAWSPFKVKYKDIRKRDIFHTLLFTHWLVISSILDLEQVNADRLLSCYSKTSGKCRITLCFCWCLPIGFFFVKSKIVAVSMVNSYNFCVCIFLEFVVAHQEHCKITDATTISH